MKEDINNYWNMILNFEPYDWFICFLLGVSFYILPSILNWAFLLFMRKVFKVEPMTYIKGWKRIKQSNQPKGIKQ